MAKCAFGLATILCFYVANGAVTLTTNYDSRVCPNTVAVMTCTTDTGTLAWQSGSENHAYSASNDSPGSSSMNMVGSFAIVLTALSGNTLTSNATVTATISVNNIAMTCSDGIAANSNSRSETILLANVFGEPLNFSSTTLNYNSISLSWLPPLEGVSVDYYLIGVNPPPTNGQCPISECRRTSNYTTISNLNHSITYMFTVRAVNCAGNGLIATLNTSIVAREPSPPNDLEVCMYGSSGSYTLKVSWNCSLMDSLSPPVVNYIVFLSSVTQSSSHTVINSGCGCGYSLSLPVHGNSLYTVLVSANNAIGSSIGNSVATIYTSANITSEAILQTSSNVFLALNVAWSACPGYLADLQLTYTLAMNSVTERHSLTLPLVSTTYIPISNLQSNALYDLTIDLLISNFSVGTLSDEFTTGITPSECITQLNTSAVVSVVTVTVTTTTTTTNSISNGTLQCISNEGSLLIGTSALGVIAFIAIMGIIIVLVLLLCLRVKYQKRRRYLIDRNTLNNNRSTYINDVHVPSSKDILMLSTDDSKFSTKLNESYGQMPSTLPDSTTQMYAEIPTIVTNNPTYVSTVSGNNTAVYAAPSESPPVLPVSPRPSDINNPAYATTGSNDTYMT